MDQESLFSILQNLSETLSSHNHTTLITRKQLQEAISEAITSIPEKPIRQHWHMSSEIKDLARPYNKSQLEKDHVTLHEPYLHEPKQHSHTTDEILGLISPDQINRIGLDADTLDGYHITDIIALIRKLMKDVHVGGGGGGISMKVHGNAMHDPRFQEEITTVSSLPAATRGKIVILSSDNHPYIAI